MLYTLVCIKKKTLRQIRNILTILITLTLLTSCKTDSKKEMSNKKVQDNFERQHTESIKDSLFALNLDTVKSNYGDNFAELRSIINRHDPIGLLKIGAPKDEYEPEVKTIIVQLKTEMTEKQVHDLIYQEFLRWFEDESAAGKKDSYKELAKDINRWNKTGFYVNENGQVHLDISSIFIDENEIGGDYKEYKPEKEQK